MRLLRENFPTLMQPPEGEVTRDQALQFVATVEDESELFYRTMAEGAPDEKARRFFEQAAAAEAVHRDALFGAAT
jgi:rubrerythrin